MIKRLCQCELRQYPNEQQIICTVRWIDQVEAYNTTKFEGWTVYRAYRGVIMELDTEKKIAKVL